MSLAGLRILVTRPAGSADGLVGRLTALGARPIHFAAIEILPPRDATVLFATFQILDSFDWAIFISPNAVTRALGLLQAQHQPWPAGVRIAAIGRGSARELKRLGYTEVVAPAGRFDSESLLALTPLQNVADRRIVVFRGEGGREVLGDTLEARGAHITYAECYRRGAPAADVAVLLRRWAHDGLDVVTLTSVEGLHNLYEVLGQVGRRWLSRTPLIVASARIGTAARALGLEGPIMTAAGADDEAMIAALMAWRADQDTA
ncbi:MAG: uroporphyrinogen-III synthase [Acidiferrobacter sp.]